MIPYKYNSTNFSNTNSINYFELVFDGLVVPLKTFNLCLFELINSLYIFDENSIDRINLL